MLPSLRLAMPLLRFTIFITRRVAREGAEGPPVSMEIGDRPSSLISSSFSIIAISALAIFLASSRRLLPLLIDQEGSDWGAEAEAEAEAETETETETEAETEAEAETE